MVIRPALEYASPVWHHLITKKQSDQIEAIQKRAICIIYPCTHDMPYTSAIFLADLPTMSDRRDQLARKLFKSTIQPTSSLHNFLPGPQDHHSITSPLKISSHSHQNQKKYQSFFSHAVTRLRVPSKFPRIPTRTKKNTNPSSPMLSPTIRLHNCCFIVFIVFSSFSTILFSLRLLLSINGMIDTGLTQFAM